LSVMAADPNDAKPGSVQHPARRAVRVRDRPQADRSTSDTDRLALFHQFSAPKRRRQCGRDAMRKHVYVDSVDTRDDGQIEIDGTPPNSGLPNRLMTTFEVAE